MIPKRIVLDTNVCLDLFVFRDPRWHALLQAMQQGEIEVITRDDCRKEWQIVLSYTHLKLDQEKQAAVAAEFDTLIRCTACLTPENAVKLPICKDKDDQKFLELARDQQADILITKDKALLKLARKTKRDNLFAIMTPETWIAAQTA